jgi:hypothetical protein
MSTLMWTCAVAGCAVGNVVYDAQGLTDHQAATGHALVLGQPMAWVFDRDAAT